VRCRDVYNFYKYNKMLSTLQLNTLFISAVIMVYILISSLIILISYKRIDVTIQKIDKINNLYCNVSCVYDSTPIVLLSQSMTIFSTLRPNDKCSIYRRKRAHQYDYTYEQPFERINSIVTMVLSICYLLLIIINTTLI
jgi:hypothetical protein